MENNIDTAGYNTPGLTDNVRITTKNSLKAKIKVDRYAPIKESDVDEEDMRKLISSPQQTVQPV